MEPLTGPHGRIDPIYHRPAMRRPLWQIGLGFLLAAAGGVLVFSPLAVAEVLGRPHTTTSQMINLRASWGGPVVGLGVFVAWVPSIRPWRRSGLGFLAALMAGIAAARAVGFVLDGHPDALQWVWMTAEIAIVAACTWANRSQRSAALG
jgi:hypothetical protein